MGANNKPLKFAVIDAIRTEYTPNFKFKQRKNTDKYIIGDIIQAID